MVGTGFWTAHIDEGALDWAIEKTAGFRKDGDIVRFLDVGCGRMGMVDLAVSKGLWACGVDADIKLMEIPELENKDKLMICDFRDTVITIGKQADIVWSMGVGEHIPDDSVYNFIKTIADAMHSHGSLLIFMAESVTGNPQHCNEQPAEYWIDKFQESNIIFSRDLTDQLRSVSTMKRDFFRTDGMVFTKLEV